MPTLCEILNTPVAVAFAQSGTAIAIGLFADDGALITGNAGIIALTGGERPTQPRSDYMVNPTFAAVAAAPGSPLFVGRMNFSDADRRHNRGLLGRIERLPEGILVCAEYDALELDRLNAEMAHLYQRASNLQRELIKKNQQLESALAELRRKEAMLIHAEKMNAMGQLVAGVAHEVNSPLGFVIGNLRSLEEDARDLDAGGHLRIGAAVQDEEHVAVTIADTGPGIPPEVLSHIFDPFFTTKPVGSGTGLGLSIAHEIVVDRHGGELQRA